MHWTIYIKLFRTFPFDWRSRHRLYRKVSCWWPQPHQSNACIVADMEHDHFRIVFDSSSTSHPIILRYIWHDDSDVHWPTQEDGASRNQCNTIRFAGGTERNSWNTDGIVLYCPVKKPVQIDTNRKRSGHTDRWYNLVLTKQEDKLTTAGTIWYYWNKKIRYHPLLQLVLSKQDKLPTAGTAWTILTKAGTLIAMQHGIIRAWSSIGDHQFATLGGKYK